MLNRYAPLWPKPYFSCLILPYLTVMCPIITTLLDHCITYPSHALMWPLQLTNYRRKCSLLQLPSCSH